MGVKQSNAEKLIVQYEEKLREMESININKIDLKGIEELCHELESLIIKINNELALKLPVAILASVRRRCYTILQRYRNIVKELFNESNELNVLIAKLAKLKAPINKSQKATFERQISTAR